MYKKHKKQKEIMFFIGSSMDRIKLSYLQLFEHFSLSESFIQIDFQRGGRLLQKYLPDGLKVKQCEIHITTPPTICKIFFLSPNHLPFVRFSFFHNHHYYYYVLHNTQGSSLFTWSKKNEFSSNIYIYIVPRNDYQFF